MNNILKVGIIMEGIQLLTLFIFAAVYFFSVANIDLKDWLIVGLVFYNLLGLGLFLAGLLLKK